MLPAVKQDTTKQDTYIVKVTNPTGDLPLTGLKVILEVTNYADAGTNNGCGPGTATQDVTVNAKPDLFVKPPPKQEFCSGAEALLIFDLSITDPAVGAAGAVAAAGMTGSLAAAVGAVKPIDVNITSAPAGASCSVQSITNGEQPGWHSEKALASAEQQQAPPHVSGLREAGLVQSLLPRTAGYTDMELPWSEHRNQEAKGTGGTNCPVQT